MTTPSKERKRYYVAHIPNGGGRTLVRLSPSQITEDRPHGTYAALVGPFRTRAGAKYLLAHPECQTVANAEKIVKSIKDESKRKNNFKVGLRKLMEKCRISEIGAYPSSSVVDIYDFGGNLKLQFSRLYLKDGKLEEDIRNV